MKINYVYTLENEVDRVLYSLSKLGFYSDNNYTVFLPKGVDESFLSENKIQRLKDVVSSEIDDSIIENSRKCIDSNWNVHGKKVEKVLSDLKLELPDKVVVKMSQYGVGGSYWPPNFIISNVKFHTFEFLFQNFVHELIHLTIFKVVQKLNLSHSEIESLVGYVITTKLREVIPKYRYKTALPSSELLKRVGWLDA